MRRAVASGLVAVVVLTSVAVGDAGSAPRAFRLLGHWGEPTLPIPNIDADSDARGMSSSSGSSWNTAVAPGGKFALLHVDSSSVGNDLLLLALPEARIVHVLPSPQVRIEAQSFALSADGRWGLFSGNANDALVWDIGRARETGRLTGLHTARVSATAIAPDGRAAITGDERGGVALWSMPDRKLRHRFSVEYDANAVAFSPDGRRGIAVGRHVVMFDVATGKELLTMYGHGPFDCVAFTPDGKRVVLASAYNHVMTVSDTATGRLLQLRKQDPVPREMAMAPDGRSVLGEGGFALGRWMLDDLAKVDKLGDYGGVGTGIGVAAGGRVFFTTDEDGELKWWDTATGNRRVSRHERALTALAWTPDGGTLIAGASDGTLSFWSASGKRLRESTRHAHAVSDIAIPPDGKNAVSVAGDGMNVAASARTRTPDWRRRRSRAGVGGVFGRREAHGRRGRGRLVGLRDGRAPRLTVGEVLRGRLARRLRRCARRRQGVARRRRRRRQRRRVVARRPDDVQARVVDRRRVGGRAGRVAGRQDGAGRPWQRRDTAAWPGRWRLASLVSTRPARAQRARAPQG